MKTFLTLLLVGSITVSVLAQDSAEYVQRKNSIKFEFTQPLYPNSVVFSYERVTKPNQTFCFTAGYEEFPHLVEIGYDIAVRDELSRGGFKTGAEYRFYLKKENKHLAPHGVYIGPYMSYHSFDNKRGIEVSFDSTSAPEYAEVSTDFRILNIGFELGYQFVLGNRWTIDIVAVGPSISKYKAKAQLEGDFTFDPEEVQSEILKKLLERFPMLEDVLSEEEISSKGTLDNWAYGWRYQFLVGYHFGGGKKKK